MKKLLLAILCMSAIGLGAQPVSAAIMMGPGFDDGDDQTTKEEAAGKVIWQQLQAKDITCAQLVNEDFDSLGEYFMSLMMGNSHAAMNLMMKQMIGEDGETQMHVVMGKRFSSCDPSAVVPVTATGFSPMMQMMWGGYNNYSGYSMMNNWGFAGLWFIVIIVAIITVVIVLVKKSGSSNTVVKTALEILQERYARGEIDKKEFDAKKKDLL